MRLKFFGRAAAYLLALSLVLLPLTACAGLGRREEVTPDYPVSVQSLQTLEPLTVEIAERPLAVVSLSPSLTATLCDLQLGGRVVGISDYCPSPSDFAPADYRYPRCGTAQNPNFSLIRRLAPDVILSATPLTEDALTRFQQLNIPVVVLPAPQSFTELPAYCQTLYKIMWGRNTGSQMAVERLQGFDRQLRDLRERVLGAVANAEDELTAVYIGPGLLTIATGDTLEGELLRALGLTNWGEDHSGFSYPQELETELMPHVIISSGNMPTSVIVGSSCYSTTPAVKAAKVYTLKPSSFETRSPQAMLRYMRDLARWLYPEAFADEFSGGPGYETPSGEVLPSSDEVIDTDTEADS